MFDVEKIREDFPSLQRKVNGYPLIYFDSAATSLKPVCVIESVDEYQRLYPANVNRAVHTLSHEATEKYISAHREVADFIGAKSWREIIFTKNATEASNIVAYSIGLHFIGKGDKIITTVMEHHANLVPWQFIARYRGAELIYVDVDDSGKLKENEVAKLVDRRTKVLAISGASNVTGFVPNLKKIIEDVKSINPDIFVVVDGAQLLPHVKVDVRELGCDFLFASGHKMLGPSGTGFLWGKEEILEEMEPFMYGGDMISRVTLEGAEWNELPFKFEAGTPNISGGIGLGEAVRYLKPILSHVRKHEEGLLHTAVDGLKKIPKVKMYTDPESDTFIGIISFNIEGAHPHDIADFLDKHGIAVRSGHHCAQPLMARLGMENSVRASFYIYNTQDEVIFFLEVLEKAVKIFSI